MVKKPVTKDDFVIALRKRLMINYGTKYYHPSYQELVVNRVKGEREKAFVAPIEKIAAGIDGFVLWNDLCSSPPQNTEQLYSDIDKFAKGNGFVSILELKGDVSSLSLEIQEQKFLVIAGISNGHAGPITCYLARYLD